MRRTALAVAALAGLAAAPGARAQDDDICADRPAKADAPCTVPRGHVQVEADVVDGAFDREHGVTTASWSVADATLKYGLSDRLDVEVELPLFQAERMHDAVSGEVERVSGFGDVSLAAKYRLTSSDARLSAAVRGFVTTPTAPRSLGVNGVEGGVSTPVQLKLDDRWSVTVEPELSSRRDEDRAGDHMETVQLVQLSRKLPAGVTLSGELWGDWTISGARRLSQASADLAAAWVVGRRVQLDGGVNLGLNRKTPGAEVYVGVSGRF